MVDTEQIKEAVDAMEYIFECYPELKRSGRKYKGCCPFHGEKTPSFFADERGFKCYGCGEKGDIIQFVMKFYNLEFHQAVEKICADNGLTYIRTDSGAPVTKLTAKEYRVLGLSGTKMKKMAMNIPAKHDAILVQTEKQLQREIAIARSHPLFADIADELGNEFKRLVRKGLSL